MLLAELHGKRCLPVESNEDFLTSAVFGHLRYVRDGAFWRAVFRRAISVGSITTNLAKECEHEGVALPAQCDLEILFWPFYKGYGEPDLLLRFRDRGGRSLILLVEVKLFSGKSECGSQDQLKRYYDLLQSKDDLGELLSDEPMTALIYLTERYAADELRESIDCSKQPLASTRMLALQWQDLLEAGLEIAAESGTFLGETMRFLTVRGFQRFRGFHQEVPDFSKLSGRLYQRPYFQKISMETKHMDGAFYGC